MFVDTVFDSPVTGLLFENLLSGAAYCRMLFEGERPVDFLCLHTNPAFSRYAGIELQGRLGSQAFSLLENEDRLLLEICGKIAHGGRPSHFSFFFSSLDQWFELSIFPPQPEHVVIVLNPIREQPQRPDRARNHHQFWGATLAAMGDAVFVCDRDGDLVEMNDAFVSFHRLRDREEFPRSSADYPRVLEIRSPGGEYLPPAQWPYQRALRGETGAGEQFHLRRPDTGLAWIGSYDFAPIRNHEGSIVGCLLVARDVTEQVARERALQNAWNELAEMKRALAAVDIAVYRLEARHGYVVDADDLMLQRLGYPLEELRRLAPWEVDLSVTEASTPAVLDSLRATGSLRVEALHRTRDGREIPVEVLVYHQPSAGDDAGSLLAFARDISPRKRREAIVEQLRQENHRLSESTLAALTASAIAHELNQPLTVVSLSSAAALRLLEAGSSAEAPLRESLMATHRGAERAAGVVRELVGFLHNRPVRRETLDLCSLVRKVARRFQAGLGPEERLLTRVGAGELRVIGNRMQLEKILANLMQNGLDAMSQRTAPRTLVVRVRREPGDAAARVSVLDNGTGMEPKQLRRVFDPFYTTKPTGLGMGLSVCEAVVQEHQGRIWALSRPGRGSIFHITLPLAAGA